jgi:phospholipid/cholesterol/gamma-HCH transport system substrate-binding protein
MEALKHNFLFKGYFEDRGYWDKAEFEESIDRKIMQLKELERDVARQSEQLRLREEQLRKQENQVHDKQID